MKLLFLFMLLLPSIVHCCEIILPGLPEEFLSDVKKIVENEKQRVLRRELDRKKNVKFLEISSNFTTPSGTPYFARLYYNSEDKEDIRLRDSLVAERNYEKEKELPEPVMFMQYRMKEFRPKGGLDLIKFPGTRLNIATDSKFSIERGGVLTLTAQLPLQDKPIKMIIKMVPQRDGTIKKFLIKDKKEIEFTQISIEAKTIFGKPNILRGVENVKFFNKKTLQHTL